MRWNAPVMLAVLLLAWPIPTPAGDEGPPWEPGARLRVTVIPPDPSPRIGVYEALVDKHLVVRADHRSFRIPLVAIRRIEVSRGRKPSVRGGVVGALVGGAIGSLSAGCLANRDDYGVPCGGQNYTKFVIGGIVGGLAGGALGALIGRGERWDDVDLESLETARSPQRRPGGPPRPRATAPGDSGAPNPPAPPPRSCPPR